MTPKDIFTNPYFCPMPWTGLMYNFNGEVKNCIRSSTPIGNICDAPIEQILQGQPNVERQEKIINKQPPQSCSPCHELERGKLGLNMISDRIFYIREFKNTPLNIYQSGQHKLETIDVRWTNLCNFACVYCGPEFSSRWSKELQVRPCVPTEQQQDAFKQYIYQHAKSLKHVYLAGGEPLLMKENLELLEQLNPDVNIRVNTNLSRTNTRVFETICQFPNVHWTVSVETTDQEFEYIRHGGQWVDFLDNLKIIQGLDHKITFNMLWLLLNYDSIFDCVDYFKDLGFHNNSFVIGPLLKPEYLNVRHLPKHVLQLLKTKLEKRIEQRPGYLLENSYQNMLHYVQQSFEPNLSGSFEKLHEMDLRRGIDSSRIFTELYKFKEDEKHGKTI